MTNHGNQPLLLDSSTFDHNGSGLKQSGHQHTRQDSHRNQQDNVHSHGVFLSSVKKVRVRATTSISPRRQVSSHKRPVYLGQRRRAELRRHPDPTNGPASSLVSSLSGSVPARLRSHIHSRGRVSRLRTQRNPVPWVCKANPPRPRADAVISDAGLCQDPPRIDRTTPFLSGPCGFRLGACW